MIKNLLYSIFLHSILLFVIYLNFNIDQFEEVKSKEVAVSLISLKGYEDATLLKPIEKPSSEEEKKKPKETEKKAKETKDAKSEKKSDQNKVKEQVKEAKKKQSAKSIKQKKLKKKKKKAQKKAEDKKQQESNQKKKKNKKDKESDKKKENKGSKKDLGNKEKSDKEQEKSQKDSKNKDEKSADMANSIENIDLSAREKFNIKSQLKLCYKRAVDETDLKSSEKILINIKISKEGYIKSNLDEIINSKKYHNPKEAAYKIAVDNVRRSLELCSPLRNLPLDKYDIWKEVLLEFSGDEIEKQK